MFLGVGVLLTGSDVGAHLGLAGGATVLCLSRWAPHLVLPGA